ncbi:microsomal glutathione S-transferase 1-like [Actinia tenebrosa]|uniref:Microsomal glutathione S-transferase 1 n=1 Tax=Actinia tenebrosa TaxID=6105 RepID=A0A6P8HJT3_ACTTE|nr:microsomal glutathione S-transferase 1-like [Actinia tenebrosa]
MATKDLLTLENPVFTSYAFYSSFLLLKLFAVVFLIVFYRITKKIFPSEEDYHDDPKGEKKMIERSHPGLDRVRRMHQNDLENIPIFILLGMLYVLSDPAYSTAIIVFRIFGAARFIHSVAYFFALTSPRGMSWMVGMICNIFLAVQVLRASKFLF